MGDYCKGRVAIVTGAGGGLGKAYALALAGEGAGVVVNDINPQTAAATVSEIHGNGGAALVNVDDITDYQAAGSIVSKTIEHFGDIHAVVNNAGVCRDRMFTSLSEEDWDLVMAVHLKGHFCISSHAARHWRQQSKAGEAVSGRIINTSSGAGLQGSVAQSNYAAAKGGILSLTLVQAAEMGRYDVTANALAPQGRTAMTQDVFAEMMKKPQDGSFDVFDPANVAPIVVWLASEHSSDVTGQCFEVFGGKISIADGWRKGPEIDKQDKWSPHELPGVFAELKTKSTPPQKVYGT